MFARSGVSNVVLAVRGESDRGPILEAVGPFAPRYCSPTVVLSGRGEREDVTGQIRQQ